MDDLPESEPRPGTQLSDYDQQAFTRIRTKGLKISTSKLNLLEVCQMCRGCFCCVRFFVVVVVVVVVCLFVLFCLLGLCCSILIDCLASCFSVGSLFARLLVHLTLIRRHPIVEFCTQNALAFILAGENAEQPFPSLPDAQNAYRIRLEAHYVARFLISVSLLRCLSFTSLSCCAF